MQFTSRRPRINLGRKHVRVGRLLDQVSLRATLAAAALVAIACPFPLAHAQAALQQDNLLVASGSDVPNQAHSAAPVTDQTAADAELPGAIYKEAMHPLDVVRQSLENWSDAELGALSVGMRTAREACDRMKPEEYTRDDLYDLAHLCAFGQDWNPANAAAQRYIAGKEPEHRTQAYAISISAYVHLNALDLALATAEEMLRNQPYDAETAYAVHYLKSYLETTGSPDALRLVADEHPKIIDALSKGAPLKAVYGDAVVNVGLLFEMAIEAAFYARYAGDDAQAAAYLDDVERAFPQEASLAGEDKQAIDSAKLQYHLLGTELEHIPVIRSYKSASAKAQIDTNFGVATALVVFPDWCVQCRKMMPTMTQFSSVNADPPIFTYGLIFAPDGEGAAPGTQKELLGTNVLQVSEETARSFGTTDYPLGIVVDHAGIIRFIGVIPSDAFNGDGYMEKVITRLVGVQARTLPFSPGQD
jgi:thiol-disulfide isomerase/thioredoxin